MKNPKEEAMRILLQNLGQSEEEIKKSLAKLRQDEENLQREQEQKEKELEGKLKTSEAAADYLQEKLGGKWSHQKVRQLKREGLLKPHNSEDGNKVKKTGYRFHVDVLDEYVKLVKTPVVELLKENQALKERLEMVEKELALHKAKPSSGVVSDLSTNLTIEGQIELEEALEEVENETPENLENPQTPPTDEELIAKRQKEKFIDDNEERGLTVESAIELLNVIIPEHPEFSDMKEPFVDEVFGDYRAVLFANKKVTKFRPPHKTDGPYSYDTKEKAIIATLKALKKQG